jgi:hypothetical protein
MSRTVRKMYSNTHRRPRGHVQAILAGARVVPPDDREDIQARAVKERRVIIDPAMISWSGEWIDSFVQTPVSAFRNRRMARRLRRWQ